MVPVGSTRLLESMLARADGEVTVRFKKLCDRECFSEETGTVGDFRTGYEIVGGSLKGILNSVQQAGFLPPVGRSRYNDGAPWTVSM